MSTELDDIKRRITALAKKTVENGCTEHEALAAMAMVGRLLQSYNLTMGECDVRKSPCVTITIPVDGTRRGPIDTCINPLTALFNGVCWFSARWEYPKPGEQGMPKRNVHYAFFVQEQDVEALRYLFVVIDRAIDNEAKAYKRGADYFTLDRAHKRKATVSFQRGMASRVTERLIELRKENDAAMEAAQATSTGTDLMVLKGKLIQEEFQKEGMRLRPRCSYARIGNHGAYDAGRNAGNSVNLNRPLNNGGGNAGLIG